MAILPILLVALVVTFVVLCTLLVRSLRPRVARRSVVVQFTGGPTLTLDAALASLDERPPARGRRKLPGVSGTAELGALRERPSSCRLRIPPKPMDFSDQ